MDFRYFFIWGWAFLLPFTSIGQTCCSGGVPISGNLGLPPNDIGIWQMSLGYDINVLKTLKESSGTLQDKSRERTTQSVLFQTGYSISNRWSLDLFMSYVKQERRIRQFDQTDYVSTNGFGDAAVLAKYRLTNPDNPRLIFTLATGAKIPTGKSDLTRHDGIPLNADLQPGSGSWDALVWVNGIYTLQLRPTATISSTMIMSLKGKNRNYLGDETYQFGNELQLLVTLNDNFPLWNKVIDTSMTLRYRKALRDRFNDLNMPNTGGDWVFLAPGLALNISPKLAVNANVELPIFSKVEGTQLSPTFRVQTGLFIKINTKNEYLKF